ncbi:MAG: hypothetical protein HKO76_05905 [Acidimicrobiia bacterium]|nr:hypothetical protein [Acidimicrobiia bacterium]
MVKKGTKKKAKWVSCTVRSCRKKPMEGSDRCRGHQNPMDVVPRLTEVELLRLGKFNSDMQNAILSAKLAAIEGRELKSKAENEVRVFQERADTEICKKEEERKSHSEEAKKLKASFDAFTTVLATKYGIDDPSKMVVDPDTGVIRDLRDI